MIVSNTPFMWRKPDPHSRVNFSERLLYEKTIDPIARAWRKSACSGCPKQRSRMLWLSWLSWPCWTSQSVYMEKRWSREQGLVTPWVSSAVEWLFVALTCPQLSLGLLLKRRAIKGRRARNEREGRGDSVPFVFLLTITPRAPFCHASRVLLV